MVHQLHMGGSLLPAPFLIVSPPLSHGRIPIFPVGSFISDGGQACIIGIIGGSGVCTGFGR